MNLTILEVVKKEVTKLLAVGIIYPISDSQWVSPVQVVPKKSGMIVMKNQHDELEFMEVFMDDFTVYADSFDASLPFELMCDASNSTLGAVLGQRARVNKPVHSYLLDSKIIVFSDHAALRFLLKKYDAKPRLIRWMQSRD
ncbi:hypothetical protein CR513_23479, partial [Mucuna pruriens]